MEELFGTLARWEQWLPPLLSAVARLALVLGVAWVLNRVSRPLIRRLEEVLNRHQQPSEEQQRRIRTLIGIVEKVVWAAIWTVAAIMALQVLGVNTTAILTAAGVGGLAVGFGAQNLVRDFISGFFLLAEDQIRVGDVAAINGTSGTVQAINPRTTVLRDLNGTVHYFPNGIIQTVSNFTREWSRYVVDLTVAYEEDVDRVIDVLKALGKELQEDPEYGPLMVEPFSILGVDSFGPQGVTIKFMVTTLPSSQWSVGRELRRRIKKRFDEEGIELPWPHTRLTFGRASSAPGGTQTEVSEALVKAVSERVVEEVLQRLNADTGVQEAAPGRQAGPEKPSTSREASV